MKFNIKIELDKVVLIGNDANLKIKRKSEIETKWVLIKGIENKIFCLESKENYTYQDEMTKEIMKSEYEIIDIEKRLKSRINEIIDKELKKIYEENKDKEDLIFDYTIKERVNEKTGEMIPCKEYEMLDYIYLFGKNIKDNNSKINIDLDISNISQGIISIKNNKYIKYDLIKDEFISSDRDILLSFYKENEIKNIITYEKYKNGISSEFYNEIAKINEFLKDKKSVTVKLKNGTIFKTDARLLSILDPYSNGKIYIRRNYYQNIIQGYDFKSLQYYANELEYIKFNKTQLNIDSDKLMIKKEVEEIEEIEER